MMQITYTHSPLPPLAVPPSTAQDGASTLTLASLWDDYTGLRKFSSLARRTRESYRYSWQSISDELKERALADIDTPSIKTEIERIQATRPGRAKSVHNLLSVLYGAAEGYRYSDANIMERVNKLVTHGRSCRDRVLCATEIRQAWSDVSKNGYVLALIRLALATGLRTSDILALRDEHIDQESGTIEIVQQKTNRPLALPVTGLIRGIFSFAVLHRDIPLQHQTTKQLMAYANESVPENAYKSALEAAWTRLPDISGRLIPLSRYAAKRAVSRYQNAQGIGVDERYRVQDMRGTMATGMAELGVSESIIERMLGHAPSDTIGRHYTAGAKRLEAKEKAMRLWHKELKRMGV